MLVNTVPHAFSAGQMRINGANTERIDSLGQGLTVNSAAKLETETAVLKKTSIYDNFSQEMSKRFTEALRKNGQPESTAADSASLVQSLTGAMGEIEQLFGREAATEAMAKILLDTSDKVDETTLLSSIQNNLAALKSLDPNGTKMKQLTESFNRDLVLAVDAEKADEKLKNGETFSLSYALAKHFGTLMSPEAENNLAAEETDKSFTTAQRKPDKEIYDMMGFDETGRWDKIKVIKLDDASIEKLQEAAEAGINSAHVLTLAALIEKEEGRAIFENLANYLEVDLQDQESAAFVKECLDKSFDSEIASPEMVKMISQVYSKVAADGDADKLSLLENYLNRDFKDALNPVLAELQKSGKLLGAEVGVLQFKGINSASLAGESDAFSLKWGYQDDDIYDQSSTKRFLQEDIRGVKAVKEKQDEAREKILFDLWEKESMAERSLREAKEAKSAKKDADQTDQAEQPETAVAKKAVRWQNFQAERRQDKLMEAMTTKFGQLSDNSRAELSEYLKNNFSSEEAGKLLAHSGWKNNLMDGLASMQSEMRKIGTAENKVNDFTNFLNGTIKNEIEGIAEALGDMNFEGWRLEDGPVGELSATFNFLGQDAATKVIIPAQEAYAGQTFMESEGPHVRPVAIDTIQSSQVTEDNGNDLFKNRQFIKGTGYLIDLVA